MAEIKLGIEMSGQKAYDAACKKYGSDFADAVVAMECQLHADNLNCFEEYAKEPDWKDVIIDSLEAEKEHEKWLKDGVPFKKE